MLARAESVECFLIPVPCSVLAAMQDSPPQFGLKYEFARHTPAQQPDTGTATGETSIKSLL